MTAAAAEDRDRVGPYRVIQAIGAGGSARIDLARIDRAYGFQRHVVLKRPLEHLRGDPRVAASLRREARIGGQLRHPNLVAILDAGVHDGYDYLVLEYVHGAALRSVMQADAPGQVRKLPLDVALAIVSDAARGMHEAHELTDDHGSPLGLVHRDVSPGNILLGLDGTVKLADFGIAKETRVSTLSGSMHGTVTYMAPEQCQGHAFDRRADVFSLGVILHELVTGRRLFWADNDVASLHRVLSGNVPRPRQLRPELSAALEDIVMTAVAHDAGRRFATALDLATALEHHAAIAGEVLSARGIARAVEAVVGPRQVPWIAAAAAAPEVAPAPGGSLVELIAATPDEPVEPIFGDGSTEGSEDRASAPRPSLTPAPGPTAAPARGPIPGRATGLARAPIPGPTDAPIPGPAAGLARAPTPGPTDAPIPGPAAGLARAPISDPAADPAPAAAAPVVPRRRRQALVAGIVALGAIAVGAGAAAVVTRGGGAPAALPVPVAIPAATSPAPSPAATSPAPPPATTTPAPPPAATSPALIPAATSPAPPPAATSPAPPPAATSPAPPPVTTTPAHQITVEDPAADRGVARADAPPATSAPAHPAPTHVPDRSAPGKRRPHPVQRPHDRGGAALAVRPADSANGDAPARPAAHPPDSGAPARPAVHPPDGDAPASPAAHPPGAGTSSAGASSPGVGSAAPAPRPVTRVEWKPTLLLPTDGSGGRDRR